MKQRLKIIIALLLAVLLTACGKAPTFDAVSDISETDSVTESTIPSETTPTQTTAKIPEPTLETVPAETAGEEMVPHTWIHTFDQYGVPLAVCWECNLTESVGGTWEPLTSRPVLEDTNTSGGSDVIIGNWNNIVGIPHAESIRFWVSNRPNLTNTESITFDLAGEYNFLAFYLGHEEHTPTILKSDDYKITNSLCLNIYMDDECYSSAVYPYRSENNILDVSGVQSLRIEISTDCEYDMYALFSAAVSKDGPTKELPALQISMDIPKVTETPADNLSESSRLVAIQSTSGFTAVVDYDEKDRIDKVTVFEDEESYFIQKTAFFNDDGQQTLLYNLYQDSDTKEISSTAAEYLYNSSGQLVGTIASHYSHKNVRAGEYIREYSIWNYNRNGQLISWGGTSGTVPFSDTYLSNISTGDVVPWGELWATYEYNRLNQLIKADYYTAPSNQLYYFMDFTYNTNGQLIRKHTTSYDGSYDSNGNYYIVDFSTNDYYYDDEGRIVRDSYLNYVAGSPHTSFYAYPSGNVVLQYKRSEDYRENRVLLLHDITGDPLFSCKLSEHPEIISENGFVTKIVSKDDVCIFQYE